MNTWRRVGQQSPIFDGSSMAGADGGGKELGAGHGEAVGRWREEVTGRSSQSPVTRERERETGNEMLRTSSVRAMGCRMLQVELERACDGTKTLPAGNKSLPCFFPYAFFSILRVLFSLCFYTESSFVPYFFFLFHTHTHI